MKIVVNTVVGTIVVGGGGTIVGTPVVTTIVGGGGTIVFGITFFSAHALSSSFSPSVMRF